MNTTMSLGTADLITGITGYTVGVLAIADALLLAFGIDWSARRRISSKKRPVWSSLLTGVGISILTASRTPTGNWLVWDLLLVTGAMLFVWGMILTVRSLRDRDPQ